MLPNSQGNIQVVKVQGEDVSKYLGGVLHVDDLATCR